MHIDINIFIWLNIFYNQDMYNFFSYHIQELIVQI